jgi:hypothetical protein
LPLSPRQIELLSRLVEASNDVHEEFLVVRTLGGMFLKHPGLRGQFEVYPPDFQALEDLGFFTVTGYSQRDGKSTLFDISPSGRQAHSSLHAESVSPSEAVEDDMRRFVDSDRFRSDYPIVCERWAAAAKLLWAEDPKRQLTEVGHYCREALQEFADVLVKDLPVLQESRKANTIARLRSVIEVQRERLGETASEMLTAMLNYWGTVSDLAQRQEHAATREGERLVWEDARRLVFQTLVVMYEIDRIVVPTRPS